MWEEVSRNLFQFQPVLVCFYFFVSICFCPDIFDMSCFMMFCWLGFLSIYLSIYQLIYLSIYLSIYHLSIFLIIYRFIYLHCTLLFSLISLYVLLCAGHGPSSFGYFGVLFPECHCVTGHCTSNTHSS